MRPLQRTGVVTSTPALPPRAGAATVGAVEGEEVAATAATAVDIPDGLKPFCRPELDGRVVAIVHENQVNASIGRGILSNGQSFCDCTQRCFLRIENPNMPRPLTPHTSIYGPPASPCLERVLLLM